ncbi:MAG TPA: sigma-70 family RNA polymerase sigma factor [Acidimicrobiales bacterium]|nr:sigma-70 family RNA polymerase sigma factor [Acidimicrobiales bacterium]
MAALVVRHWETVHRVCLAKLSRPEDAEDATQETFIRFLQADLHGICNPEAWLVAVALRVCYGVLRRRYNTTEVDFDNVTDRVLHHDQTEHVLNAAWFLRIVESLPAVERKVLTWLYVGRLSREQMAERLGVSTGHLRVIAFRARRRAQTVAASLDGGFAL